MAGYVKVVCHKGAPVPERAYRNDAGLDLTTVNRVVVTPDEVKELDTGVRMALPKGTYGLVTLRSSWAKRGLLMPAPGIIDSGYRGKIRVLVYSLRDIITLEPGMRIAQIVITKCDIKQPMRVSSLTLNTARKTKGLGSSGDEADATQEWPEDEDIVYDEDD